MFPKDYKPKLSYFETQKGIKLVRETFEKGMRERLSLQKITAPIFLKTGTGLQDDLAGTQVPVGFDLSFTEASIEIVQALTKWKRQVLGKHEFDVGTGLIVDMKGIRKDEELSEIHSIFVDQWDWERVISRKDRKLSFLKNVVRKIYLSILDTEKVIESEFPALTPSLPKRIKFIHTQDLERMFPDSTPKQREHLIAEKYGAVFLVGIGHPLESGEPHDLRAADYDDWYIEAYDGKRGLNGDIIVWDGIRRKSMELTSMGIRVDSESLVRQLEIMDLMDKKELEYHSGIIEGRLPLTIGGGFGQSRLCMLLLKKAHIGEVQSSVWPKEVEKGFEERGIPLL
ncbi:MAG: aspartate--ammonia ligase [Candidatus Aenigmarchaeota archaeon]|nr:aspartate--ammonia ligase [Candidatus Aenigmarchaeota archaeon]